MLTPTVWGHSLFSVTLAELAERVTEQSSPQHRICGSRTQRQVECTNTEKFLKLPFR